MWGRRFFMEASRRLSGQKAPRPGMPVTPSIVKVGRGGHAPCSMARDDRATDTPQPSSWAPVEGQQNRALVGVRVVVGDQIEPDSAVATRHGGESLKIV